MGLASKLAAGGLGSVPYGASQQQSTYPPYLDDGYRAYPGQSHYNPFLQKRLEQYRDWTSLGEIKTSNQAHASQQSLPKSSDSEEEHGDFEKELEQKWILNLSMRFRDDSREKFFVTYLETPNRWRRVTVSCDYHNAPRESLEEELQGLCFQRDKNTLIYESLQDSLPNIQFYDTVTNLRLETKDERLHVHVTEDVNEIISLPPLTAVQHIDCKRFKESELTFKRHLSGFAYKGQCHELSYMKKDIPGPGSISEFLYEINESPRLGIESIGQLEGLVVDENGTVVKGLLVSSKQGEEEVPNVTDRANCWRQGAHSNSDSELLAPRLYGSLAHRLTPTEQAEARALEDRLNQFYSSLDQSDSQTQDGYRGSLYRRTEEVDGIRVVTIFKDTKRVLEPSGAMLLLWQRLLYGNCGGWKALALELGNLPESPYNREDLLKLTTPQESFSPFCWPQKASQKFIDIGWIFKKKLFRWFGSSSREHKSDNRVSQQSLSRLALTLWSLLSLVGVPGAYASEMADPHLPASLVENTTSLIHHDVEWPVGSGWPPFNDWPFAVFGLLLICATLASTLSKRTNKAAVAGIGMGVSAFIGFTILSDKMTALFVFWTIVGIELFYAFFYAVVYWKECNMGAGWRLIVLGLTFVFSMVSTLAFKQNHSEITKEDLGRFVPPSFSLSLLLCCSWTTFSGPAYAVPYHYRNDKQPGNDGSARPVTCLCAQHAVCSTDEDPAKDFNKFQWRESTDAKSLQHQEEGRASPPMMSAFGARKGDTYKWSPSGDGPGFGKMESPYRDQASVGKSPRVARWM